MMKRGPGMTEKKRTEARVDTACGRAKGAVSASLPLPRGKRASKMKGHGRAEGVRARGKATYGRWQYSLRNLLRRCPRNARPKMPRVVSPRVHEKTQRVFTHHGHKQSS